MAKNDEDPVLTALMSGTALPIPLDQVPVEDLPEIWARHADARQQADANELILELTGVSSRHLMIFPDQDPRARQRLEEERQWRRRQEQEIAQAEYAQTMAEVRQRADLLMAKLGNQRRDCLVKLADADNRAIVLPDGRHVLVGENGEYIEEATGKTLQGADQANAQRLRKPDSETAAERKKLCDWLSQIDDAEEHVRRAEALGRQEGKNLSPDEMKQREAEARGELGKAEALASKETEVPMERAVAEAKAKGATFIDVATDTDMASALGLGTPQDERTTSFAATMDGGDNRATDVQNQFAGAAKLASIPPAAAPDTAAPVGSAAGTAASKSKFQQGNQ